MCHNDNGQPKFLPQPLKYRQNFMRCLGVHCPGWFIGQQDLRHVGKRRSDGHSLRLSSGELCRIGIRFLSDADQG